MAYLNWTPENDPYLKPAEKTLHEKLHAFRADKVKSKEDIFSERQFRIDAINTILNKNDVTVAGDILEIGAGDGWCSAYLLSTYESIKSIHIMECTENAVTSLIPKTIQSANVQDSNIQYVLGSFNDIQITEGFDFVIAMGALHHSQNLFHTMSEVFKALKPGGIVISQEPFMVDQTKNSYYTKYNEIVKDFGIGNTIKNSERTDVFYRKCEYYTAAYHAGFDVDIVELIVNEDRPSSMVMMLQKPAAAQQLEVVTRWEK